MGTRTGLVNEIADFAVGAADTGVPAAVIEDAQLRLVDIVGLCLCVNRTADSRQLRAEMRHWGELGNSTIIGFGQSLAPTAALMNGIMSHAEDFDDTHTESLTHVSAAVVPAALAIAEEQGACGAALLRAIALGEEVAVRIGLGARGQFHARGFHTTGIVGAFGATVAASLLMRLSTDTTAQALAIAASMSAGIFEFLANGSTVKRMHPGWAAKSGITAARLARGGVTGPATALEGRQGLYRTHIGDTFAPDIIVAGLGRKWHAPDTSFKPYPCCHFLHAPLDALGALQDEYFFAVDDVDSVVCLVPEGAIPVVAEPVNKKRNPTSGYDAKFSAYFALAALLVKRRVDLASYSSEQVTDQVIRHVMARIVCRADPESAAYPTSFGGAVEVILRDRRRLFRRVLHNRGAPSNPMSQGDVTSKFQNNAGTVLGAVRTDRLLQQLLVIDGVDDVGEVLRSTIITPDPPSIPVRPAD